MLNGASAVAGPGGFILLYSPKAIVLMDFLPRLALLLHTCMAPCIGPGGCLASQVSSVPLNQDAALLLPGVALRFAWIYFMLLLSEMTLLRHSESMSERKK